MPPNTPEYVPILKARENEIVALRRRPTTLNVVPYFELQAVTSATIDPATNLPKRNKSAVTDASYFLDDIARLWDRDFYLDLSRVATPAERENWWQLITACSALTPPNRPIIPALAEDDPPAAWAAAALLAQLANRAAIRIKMPHASPAALPATITAGADELGIAETAVDVVLDWGDSMEQTVVSLDDLENLTVDAMTAIGGARGRVITAGTPNSKKFVQAGYWAVKRREWQLWLRLHAAGHDVAYGDYCLYPPSDPVKAGPQYGHLRYSSGDSLHVHRAARPASGGGLKAAFSECCDVVTAASHFLGATFSSADTMIEEISLGITESGSAGHWRQLAAIHHFALVDNQLQHVPAAPPAGTL